MVNKLKDGVESKKLFGKKRPGSISRDYKINLEQELCNPGQNLQKIEWLEPRFLLWNNL
jgi:hypothetical protein